ncbi:MULTISPECIES: lysophospholipid acyltransferase [Nocardioides]|uniref:lysophospholipid acyltransferase n=1 Tax=Nocardioides TaxID=1839 RepID=UPI000330C95E|nr:MULTISPECIES: lysophospholipid acyltransferase [Nocardioides]EON24870.1 glycerol-3-phosphate acyltransferase [Nocardioides sp. CF8]
MTHQAPRTGSAVTRAKGRGKQLLAPLTTRVGLASPDPADGHEVAQILADEAFGEKLASLAEDLGRPKRQVGAEAGAHLREMSATHSAGTGAAFRRFSQWLARAHDVYIDEDSIARLRALDRQHSLLFLFSHRSYLDGALVPEVVASGRMSTPFTFGGANLNFFPMGSIASRSGVIFIKRSTSDIPVYRQALRSYIAQLLKNRSNLAWSIEGGRTRTGKLRPPAFGIMRYVADAVCEADGVDALIVPVSIVYDQLHEVSMMTSEAKGAQKRPEDLRWLYKFAREQRHRLGRAYVDFGEPISLAARMAELHADESAAPYAIERIALESCHRINRATPVTATAIVSMAILGEDRALSLAQVQATVAPIADYLAERGWRVAGAFNLKERETLRRTLQELVASGVLVAYDGGTETVWHIAPDKHLVAAFYRNTAIHVFVDRAIGELALLAAAESDSGDIVAVAEAEALRLRELLKFDFFFSGRHEFGADIVAELRGVADPTRDRRKADTAELRARLATTRPHVAHLVLRPFLDAYHVVADRLADLDVPFSEPEFLDDCIAVGQQWALQGRITSDESVTLELFRTALRLADHRGLLDSETPDLDKLRHAFADEIAMTTARVDTIAEFHRAGRA